MKRKTSKKKGFWEERVLMESGKLIADDVESSSSFLVCFAYLNEWQSKRHMSLLRGFSRHTSYPSTNLKYLLTITSNPVYSHDHLLLISFTFTRAPVLLPADFVALQVLFSPLFSTPNPNSIIFDLTIPHGLEFFKTLHAKEFPRRLCVRLTKQLQRFATQHGPTEYDRVSIHGFVKDGRT